MQLDNFQNIEQLPIKTSMEEDAIIGELIAYIQNIEIFNHIQTYLTNHKCWGQHLRMRSAFYIA